METYFTRDAQHRKHELTPVPQLRNGLPVDYTVKVSRYEADGRCTELHYFIAELNFHWPTEALALFQAQTILENHYAMSLTP